MKYHWVEYLGFALMGAAPILWLHGFRFIGDRDFDLAPWATNIIASLFIGGILSLWGQERRLSSSSN